MTCNAWPAGEALMPIRPEYRWFYPIDWPQLSAAIRLVVRRADASIAVARTAAWSFTSGMVVGGTTEAATWRNGRGRALSLPTHRLSREMTGSSRPKSCWRPPTSITIRATTRSAISKPTVNAATCCMTAKSIAAGGGSLFERRMPWVIYFSGPIPISLKAARLGRLRRTGRDRWRANG